MPITAHRPASAYTLTNLPNNGVLSAAHINGWQNAMSHYAERGMSPAIITSQRVNGVVQPAVGVCRKAPGNQWVLTYRSISVPFTVSPGHNWFTLYAAYRLNMMYADPNQQAGSTLTFEIVKGGAAAPVTFASWRSLLNVTGAVGSILVNAPLPQILSMSPVDTELLYLRVTFDLAEGNRALDGQAPLAGAYTASDFWNGLNWATIASYKDCDEC